MSEQKHIQAYQLMVLIASIILIVLLFTAWHVSGSAQEWRRYQKDYNALLEEFADTLSDITFNSVKGPQQILAEDLNRTDRCVSCHLGIENPLLEGKAQPFADHPGDYLQQHPPEKYGCTICHAGQGRAMNSREAHGTDNTVRWEHPLLSQPYLQSSCGQCHLTIYGEAQVFAGTEVYRHGQDIFNREGCLGCHKARGVGGIVGPDLTEQGEKTRNEYSFENIITEQTISNWLKEHFRDPEMVSPGSQMLKIDLPEADLDALSTFVLGLVKPDIAFEYFSLEALNEFKGNRNEIEGERAYGLICSACHGKDGEGKSYTDYTTGVPGILRADFVRVASEEYVEFTLDKGRSMRQMASWIDDISGLHSQELDSLVGFVKAVTIPFSYDQGSFLKGNAIKGNEGFSNLCASCHGEEGSGGVAAALNNEDLLRNAENAYLFQTIVKGRMNATMPAWYLLDESEVYDLITYMRTWGSYAPRDRNPVFTQSDAEAGKLKYHFMCSRCHGEAGQGQTGPALINKDFISAVSDVYLYNTIAYGRTHSAMFGWSVDVYNAERLGKEDIGNLIAYIRGYSYEKAEYVYAGSNPGDRESGGLLYGQHCAECHGENGEGVEAPALNNQELLSAGSNGYLQATITIGREGTAMPDWGYPSDTHVLLSGEQRADIVAWLRGWERIRIGVE